MIVKVADISMDGNHVEVAEALKNSVRPVDVEFSEFQPSSKSGASFDAVFEEGPMGMVVDIDAEHHIESKIVQVTPGSMADRGVKAGQYIVRIAGEDVQRATHEGGKD